MDEDPYNLIGESDGELSNSFISRMRESNDSADPYATVEDDSGGDQKCLSPTTGIGEFCSRRSFIRTKIWPLKFYHKILEIESALSAQ